MKAKKYLMILAVICLSTLFAFGCGNTSDNESRSSRDRRVTEEDEEDDEDDEDDEDENDNSDNDTSDSEDSEDNEGENSGEKVDVYTAYDEFLSGNREATYVNYDGSEKTCTIDHYTQELANYFGGFDLYYSYINPETQSPALLINYDFGWGPEYPVILYYYDDTLYVRYDGVYEDSGPGGESVGYVYDRFAVSGYDGGYGGIAYYEIRCFDEKYELQDYEIIIKDDYESVLENNQYIYGGDDFSYTEEDYEKEMEILLDDFNSDNVLLIADTDPYFNLDVNQMLDKEISENYSYSDPTLLGRYEMETEY